MSSSHNKTGLDFPIEECYASFRSHHQTSLVNQIGNSNQKLIYKIYLRQGETAQGVSNRKIKIEKKTRRKAK